MVSSIWSEIAPSRVQPPAMISPIFLTGAVLKIGNRPANANGPQSDSRLRPSDCEIVRLIDVSEQARGAVRTRQSLAESFNGGPVQLAVLGQPSEVVVEGGMDHPIGLGRAAPVTKIRMNLLPRVGPLNLSLSPRPIHAAASAFSSRSSLLGPEAWNPSHSPSLDFYLVGGSVPWGGLACSRVQTGLF